MSEKPKVAFYWCSSCGGCEEAVVDLAEKILDVVAAVDIVFWPVALDFKKADVEAMEDGSILAAFVNGAIRTTEQEEMAHLLRRKAKVLVAFGSCAHLGRHPRPGQPLGPRGHLRHRVPHDARRRSTPMASCPQARRRTTASGSPCPASTTRSGPSTRSPRWTTTSRAALPRRT